MAMPGNKNEDDNKKNKNNKNNKNNKQGTWWCNKCQVFYDWEDLNLHRYCHRARTPLTPDTEEDAEEHKDDK